MRKIYITTGTPTVFELGDIAVDIQKTREEKGQKEERLGTETEGGEAEGGSHEGGNYTFRDWMRDGHISFHSRHTKGHVSR